MSVLYYRALGLMRDEDRPDKREKWKKPGLALDLLASNTRQALGEFRDLRGEVVALRSELVSLGSEIRGLSAGFGDLSAQLDLLLAQVGDIEVAGGRR